MSFDAATGFSIVGADIIVDSDDHRGVHIAAKNLSTDLQKVTGHECNTRPSHHTAIVIGSLDRSKFIQQLVKDDKLDVTRIRGKWESWVTATVSDPFPGYKLALVIAGSDKRGVIFGTYSLAEQIGVSP